MHENELITWNEVRSGDFLSGKPACDNMGEYSKVHDIDHSTNTWTEVINDGASEPQEFDPEDTIYRLIG